MKQQCLHFIEVWYTVIAKNAVVPIIGIIISFDISIFGLGYLISVSAKNFNFGESLVKLYSYKNLIYLYLQM